MKCRCGDTEAAHTHYRRGSDCSRCPCRRYRPTVRTIGIPYREWPLRARVVERLYRWTHGGQIRTLVVKKGERLQDHE